MDKITTIIENTIWTVDGFLSKEQCEYYIDRIDNKTGIIPFTDSGYFKNDKYTDVQLTEYLYRKLKKTGIDTDIIRANNLIMTGKYLPGDKFGLHTDTGLFYDSKTKEKSSHTLLIYLNDDLEGGETVFYDDKFNQTKIILPKQGKALLFDISLWHQGSEIIYGNKYWIGCEMISLMV